MPNISASDLEQARSMRASGASWGHIGKRFGVNYETIRRRLDHKWAMARQSGKNEARRWHKGSKPPAETVHDQGPRPTAEEVAALRRLIPPDTRDLTSRLMGDPLPGRRALDQRASA